MKPGRCRPFWSSRQLTLADGTTPREKIEGAVRSLGYQIELRKAGAKKDFVLPGAVPEDDHDEAEGHSHDDGHDHDHDDAGQDHSEHDHAGRDAAPKAAKASARDDSGHGSPGHVHDDPEDLGKRWYQTGKGKLVIFTALLLGAAWIIEYLAPDIGKWAFVAACLIGVAPVAQRAFAMALEAVTALAAGDVLGEKRELGRRQLEEFVDVRAVGDDAAAVIRLLFEEIKRGDLHRADLDHEILEALIFAAIQAVGEVGHG